MIFKVFAIEPSLLKKFMFAHLTASFVRTLRTYSYMRETLQKWVQNPSLFLLCSEYIRKQSGRAYKEVYFIVIVNSTNLIEVAKHSENMFSKVQNIHLMYLTKVADLNTECYNYLCSSLTKNIKDNIQDKGVGLKEVVDVLVGVYSDTREELILVKAKLYYMDGEKYRLIGDQRSYSYFKKRCGEEFKKLKSPELIKQFQEKMGSYIPKKYAK